MVVDPSHDICYTRCYQSKAACDKPFAPCMYDRCRRTYGKFNPLQAVCIAIANKYFAAVALGGCGAFKKASARHCKC